MLFTLFNRLVRGDRRACPSLIRAAFFLTPLCLHAVHATPRFPFDFQGKVIYVDDGDTFIMLDAEHRKHPIRLTDVDAPEAPHQKYAKAGQPYSAASGRNLAVLAKGKIATASCYEYDQHERLVCRVFVDGIDVSLAQIQAGFGWANAAAGKRYVRDDRAYVYEAEAKRERRGLWRDTAPIAPWIWRRICWKEGICAGE